MEVSTDTQPDLAVAIAWLMQQREELCAALSDIHSTACIALGDQLSDGQRRLWGYLRAVADDASTTAIQHQQGEVK